MGVVAKQGRFFTRQFITKACLLQKWRGIIGQGGFFKNNWPIVAPMFDTLLFIYVFALVVAS